MSVCGADSCLFVDKKMINEGGNFVYILYICEKIIGLKTSKDEENSINAVVGCDGCIAGKLRRQ